MKKTLLQDVFTSKAENIERRWLRIMFYLIGFIAIFAHGMILGGFLFAKIQWESWVNKKYKIK